ncbi:hypothetical protein GW17_00014083 [Ensete ventricosum]|nr:hypothetical protein GW17_00014083 [Ensete ventricosum]
MKRPAQVDFVSRDSLPRGGGSGSSSLGVHGKGPARRSYQGEDARHDPYNTSRYPELWVVDRALDFTFDDTSGMVNSYDRLLSVQLEWLVVVHPNGATQGHETPSLMNASQRDFSCRGGQIIAFPPRPGLHQLGCLLDLGATIYC